MVGKNSLPMTVYFNMLLACTVYSTKEVKSFLKTCFAKYASNSIWLQISVSPTPYPVLESLVDSLAKKEKEPFQGYSKVMATLK